MKEFVVYSLMRLGLFLAVLAVVLGIWIKVFGSHQSIIWPILIAFVLSGVLSISLLNAPREAFARRVESRAQRASARLDEMKSKED